MRKAQEVGNKVLPPYRHKYSPKFYTQAQLFACLVLKSFLRTDYRGVEQILKDAPSLCQAINLRRVPHFTTLQKSEKQLLEYKQVKRMMEETIFFGARS